MNAAVISEILFSFVEGAFHLLLSVFLLKFFSDCFDNFTGTLYSHFQY